MTSPLFLSIFAFGAGRQGNWNNFFRLPALLPLLEYVPQISRQHIPTALSFPSLSLSQPLPLALAFFLPRSHLPLSMPTIAAHHHRFELALLLLLFAIYFIFDLSDFAWRLGNMLLATFMSSLSLFLSVVLREKFVKSAAVWVYLCECEWQISSCLLLLLLLLPSGNKKHLSTHHFIERAAWIWHFDADCDCDCEKWVVVGWPSAQFFRVYVYVQVSVWVVHFVLI